MDSVHSPVESEGGGAVVAHLTVCGRLLRKSFIQVRGGKSKSDSLLTSMSGMIVLKAEL